MKQLLAHQLKQMLAARTTDGELVPFKTPYNHDITAECQRTATSFTGESKTQQHFKDEQDINKIVARVLQHGQLPEIPSPLQYGDLTTMDDFHTMQNKLAETRALFYRLKPETRAEYSNDPGAWLEDVNDKLTKGNLEPLRKMGLDMASVDAQIATLRAQADEAAEQAAKQRYDEKAALAASKAAKD